MNLHFSCLFMFILVNGIREIELLSVLMIRSFQLIATVNLVRDGHVQPGTDIIAIQHLPDQFAVCVCTSSGDVFLWNVTTNQVRLIHFLTMIPLLTMNKVYNLIPFWIGGMCRIC